MEEKDKNNEEEENVWHYSVDYKSTRIKDTFAGENRQFTDAQSLDKMLSFLNRDKKYLKRSNNHYEPTLIFQTDRISIKVVTSSPSSSEVFYLSINSKEKKDLEEIMHKHSLPLDREIRHYRGNYRFFRGD